MKKIIATKKAPAAIGPYSQAVMANGFIFCSGQIPLKADGTIVASSIRDQATQVMTNLKAVLEAAGSSLDKVVKTTIYLTDLKYFQAVNEVYGGYFTENSPARATVQVTALPKGVEIEIEAVAIAPAD